MDNNTYLITGAAGFIGFHLSKVLLENGKTVVGFDNLNSYYDVSLKHQRLELLKQYEAFKFIKGDLSDKEQVNRLFADFSPEIVVNLAAQAGVRYSITYPQTYIDSNIIGFFNILEACRSHPVKLLCYASSSSVYGNQKKTPFTVLDSVDKPISLYAATKKSNELMAYTYSHLFAIPTVGLRFFTVYGPYGRPDMAYFKFADKIMGEEPLEIYNYGDMLRDFTYIDDIVDGMLKIMSRPLEADENGECYRLYNIGNNKPESLMHFIEVLENALGKQAQKVLLPMQPGDVYQTYADITELQNEFGFTPKTDIEAGLKIFADWYKAYRKERWGKS